jgi:hypothetical protein
VVKTEPLKAQFYGTQRSFLCARYVLQALPLLKSSLNFLFFQKAKALRERYGIATKANEMTALGETADRQSLWSSTAGVLERRVVLF